MSTAKLVKTKSSELIYTRNDLDENVKLSTIKVLNRLVDKGNTVIIIEHNLDVIKVADYIIDIGPEGGNRGGYIICTGTPQEIIQNKKSETGRFLKKELTAPV